MTIFLIILILLLLVFTIHPNHFTRLGLDSIYRLFSSDLPIVGTIHQTILRYLFVMIFLIFMYFRVFDHSQVLSSSKECS